MGQEDGLGERAGVSHGHSREKIQPEVLEVGGSERSSRHGCRRPGLPGISGVHRKGEPPKDPQGEQAARGRWGSLGNSDVGSVGEEGVSSKHRRDLAGGRH